MKFYYLISIGKIKIEGPGIKLNKIPVHTTERPQWGSGIVTSFVNQGSQAIRLATHKTEDDTLNCHSKAKGKIYIITIKEICDTNNDILSFSLEGFYPV